jgi:hypothetical protein
VLCNAIFSESAQRLMQMAREGRTMTGDGQTWIVVVATGEAHSSADSASLHGALTLAMAVAPREHIRAVVTPEQRRTMEGPLWLLPASHVIAHPPPDVRGILAALLRISKRDPGARVVLLPSTDRVPDPQRFADALRTAVIDMTNSPESVVRVAVEPDGADTGVVAGSVRALLQFLEQRVSRSATPSPSQRASASAGCPTEQLGA